MNDDVFRNNIRMVSALSFVLIADTMHAFYALCNHAGNAEQVILDYFERYYTGELRRYIDKCLDQKEAVICINKLCLRHEGAVH